jgi:hypothetical protein
MQAKHLLITMLEDQAQGFGATPVNLTDARARLMRESILLDSAESEAASESTAEDLQRHQRQHQNQRPALTTRPGTLHLNSPSSSCSKEAETIQISWFKV